MIETVEQLGQAIEQMGRMQRILPLRACLKKTIETRCGRFGVPPLGGFCAAPPKGGTPNRVFKQALIGEFAF